jgi:hypothetical protein
MHPAMRTSDLADPAKAIVSVINAQAEYQPTTEIRIDGRLLTGAQA